MTKSHEGSRRRFLGQAGAAGLGLGALTLPFLRAERARAAGAAPKRFIVWFTPNGTYPETWFPSGTESNFTLKRALEPLAPYKSKLLVLDNLDMLSRQINNGGVPTDDHQQSPGQLLTGRQLLAATGAAGAGKSLDQVIADKVADMGVNVRKSYEFGIQTDYGRADNGNRISYVGANQPLNPTRDPRAAFNDLFGGFTPGTTPNAAEVKRNFMRRSVLDSVTQDMGRAKARLGSESGKRLDAHLTAIREIETNLESPTAVMACDTPSPNYAGVDFGDDRWFERNDNYPVVAKAHIDIGVAALACDRTRVMSFQFQSAAGYTVMTWLTVNGVRLAMNGADPGASVHAHHALSHATAEAFGQAAIAEIDRWHATQFHYLLDKLANTDEPDGSGKLIDNTVILWVNELGNGISHSDTRMPFLLAGNVGGHFRTGRFVNVNKQPHNNLLVSLAQAYGIQTTTFGDPAFCTGALTGLT